MDPSGSPAEPPAAAASGVTRVRTVDDGAAIVIEQEDGGRVLKLGSEVRQV